MPSEYAAVEWDAQLEDRCQELIRMALEEDLGDGSDWTTVALVEGSRQGRAAVVARGAGVVCGMRIGAMLFEANQSNVSWHPEAADGDEVEPGQAIARVEGPARHLLTYERTLLNFLGRMAGVATLTREYCQRVEESDAEIYDTRKTTPGWRRLEKYAVRCGGGKNHRAGLNEAVFVKDNHIALSGQQGLTPADAVRRARAAVDARAPQQAAKMVFEVEVDTLEQLREVLDAEPDVVLLDNMTVDELEQAVKIRNAHARGVLLEASGGVNLETVGAIGKTGVERISVGALTHSAVSLDLGLDWQT